MSKLCVRGPGKQRHIISHSHGRNLIVELNIVINTAPTRSQLMTSQSPFRPGTVANVSSAISRSQCRRHFYRDKWGGAARHWGQKTRPNNTTFRLISAPVTAPHSAAAPARGYSGRGHQGPYAKPLFGLWVDSPVHGRTVVNYSCRVRCHR